MNNFKYDPMHQWASDLFPICRSITGEGVRQTLRYIKDLVPELEIHRVASGTKVYDWTIPDEWAIEAAYIEDSKGNKIVDFQDNNLHILNYSEPVDDYFSLDELKNHLYSLPEMPDAIPYVTSYYKRRWGFCLEDKKLKNLKEDQYHVVIKSSFSAGELNYGEIIIPGETKEEIFFSSYICHPSMANNELSGPVLATALARFIKNMPDRRYTYRFCLAPETIGAISYISKNIDSLKKNVVAAFNLTCVGNEDNFSFMPSRLGNTLADRVALYVLNSQEQEFNHYSFLQRGSDERHYCSPGVDLPMISIMRTKYGQFPEYHTSFDNLDFITQKALEGSFDIHRKLIEILEKNKVWKTINPCEPHLSKHKLYPDIGLHKTDYTEPVNILNFLAYADGNHDLVAISETINLDIDSCADIADKLNKASLIKEL